MYTQSLKKMRVYISACLPDDVWFIVFQYCTEKEIKNTRPCLSKSVNKCTMSFDMRTAIKAGNLENMKWIWERCFREACDALSNFRFYHYDIPYELAQNFELVKWLLMKGVRITSISMIARVFNSATERGDLDFMKWFRKEKKSSYLMEYEELCNLAYIEEGMVEFQSPFSMPTFSSAATNGDLVNMKWLKDEKCPYSQNTFSCAAKHGDLENMKWLKITTACLINPLFRLQQEPATLST